MSTTIRLTPHGEALLQKQLEKGAYRSPEEVVERALETLEANSEQTRVESSKKTVAEAVDDILELRESLTLGGLKIKDLIQEGRKY
jgi:Arc/MetJ-type ribon-helix-helix transcriptional regulator